MKYIDQNIILEKTNGGLDIITWKYPEAIKAVERPGTKFKAREGEKTASCSLKKLPDGTWLVTDFGGDAKPRSGIGVVMLEDGVEFKLAIQMIAEKFGISDEPFKQNFHKSKFEKRDATPEEAEGEYYFDVNDQFSEFELKEIFSDKVIDAVISDARKNNKGELPADPYLELRKILKKYHCFSLKSFTQIKDRKALISSSTEVYPIFMFDYGTWKKIYQPKNPEKQYRFRYVGKKDEKFIFGLQQCIHAYNDLQKQEEPDNIDAENTEGEAGLKVKKLKEIILCSGDRDALNVAAMHYQVVWLNSESAKLSWTEYTSIARLCQSVYNLPDIDSTGKRQAHELAMEFLQLKTIWLPEELKEKKDFRYNACKDLRDYMRFWTRRSFDDLVKVALPYQFWDLEPVFNKKTGEFMRNDYKFNNVQCYNFLYRNGFGRFKQENQKEGYIFIQIEGNIVREIDVTKVKDFVNNFLLSRHEDIKLRNTFYRSNQLSETSLSNLPFIEVDFTDFSKDEQYLFFKNRTWCITKDEIKDYRIGGVDKFIWEDEVIQRRVEKLDDMFKITYDPTNERHDIEIIKSDCLFFRYLINASRIHWRKELEELPENEKWEEQQIKDYQEKYQYAIDGPNLSIDEIAEQKMHLINKMYSFGYLLHRYKDASKTWAVFAMDNKISEQGESHGGSGKSIAYKSIRYFMKSLTLEGRNPKLTDNAHIYENVTPHTDYILVDDCYEYLKFDFFYSSITGEMSVNPKNNKQFVIQFDDVAKFAFTSNFPVKNADHSTERRLLYTVFSDYYHFNKNNDYKQERKVIDDFGKNLFQDFTEAEWNEFINFMAQCVKFYMTINNKIDPPMDNVTKRTLIAEMGGAFQAWADTYFSPEGNRLDSLVSKKEAFKSFVEENKIQWTTQKFTKAMKAWCRFHHYTFDPPMLQNASGRIIRKIAEVATEMIYVQTKATLTVTTNDNTEDVF